MAEDFFLWHTMGMTRSLRVVLFSVLTACGSGYVYRFGPLSRGLGDGYTSKSIDDSSFVVTYRGGIDMRRGLAARWALTRAAQIARDAGYRKFAAAQSLGYASTGTDCVSRVVFGAVVTECDDSGREVATVEVRLFRGDPRPGDDVHWVAWYVDEETGELRK